MKKINFTAVLCALAMITAMVSFAETAKPGSCMAKAIALKASQTVTLVNEYDSEFKDFYDSGVCYYKVTLKKGSAYSFWISGGAADDLMLTVDVDWTLEEFPMASCDYAEYSSGVKAAFMYDDAWDEDDPSSFTYYVSVSGEIGQQTMLYFTQGIMSFTQIGEESNPKRITVGDAQASESAKLIDGDYFFVASLVAGRKYMFRTTGGVASAPLGLSVEPAGDFMQESIPEYTNDVGNTSLYIYPTVTQDYLIDVSSRASSDQSFKFKFRSYPSRLPGEHESVKLCEANGYLASGVPGRTVADASYYDTVIDESLFRIKLQAGEKWAFETSGATNAIKMVVYDVNGAILRENTTMGNGAYDCRAVISATYDGWHYVGICRPELQYWDAAPTDGAVTVSAMEVSGVELPDDFDSLDDQYSGAELLDTLPSAAGVSVVDAGSASGMHGLNVGDWYDWFCFAGRSGVTYALKASFATGESTDLKLGAKVYKMVGGSLVKVSDTSGSISPDGTDEIVKPLTFAADANAMYYVRVSVAEGVGLDYPAYRVHAVAYMDGTELGLVRVFTKGVDSTWYFTDDSAVRYPSGVSVAVSADVSKNIRFTDVSGFSTPPKTPVLPVAWTGADEDVAIVVGTYNDSCDPADDTEAGVVSISPVAIASKAKRTLWKEDAADWFRFRATAGFYYSFWLVDTTEGGAGDAEFSIKYYTDETNIVEGVTECMKKSFDPREKGKFNLCVRHGTVDKKDTAYRLYYKAVNVGTVRFATTTPSVGEEEDYVDVVVQRTASEGAVRVNYATEAYTAQPGSEYYPVSGVLEWADGDMADKTIRVRLIPDLEEEWDAQLRFRIRLWPMAEDALAEDEYPAVIENDTATVKIKEMSAQKPGTVKVVDGGLSAVAGNPFSLTIARVGGSDGRIAVKVKTQPGTALAGTDYVHANRTLVWEDGDATEKTFDIVTMDSGSHEDKSFNIKMTALTTDAYADCEEPMIAEKKTYLTLTTGHPTGSVVMTSPAKRSVAAGSTLKAVFSRVGGNSGRIAVKVKTQDAGAVAEMTAVAGSDFTYAKDYLVWEDGDVADKTFEVVTAPVATYGDPKTFRLKLSALTTGEYDGCLTPSLPDAKIVVTIENRLVPYGGGAVTTVAGYDAYGNAISAGSPIALVRGVKATVALGLEDGALPSVCGILAGALPPGMKLDAKSFAITGAPTAAGDYAALVQVNGEEEGAGLWLDFNVVELGAAAGAFSACVRENGNALSSGYARVGRITALIVGESGNISATVKVGGLKYTFASSSYDALDEDDSGFCVATLHGVTTIDGEEYENTLELSVANGAVYDPAVLGASAGVAKLRLNVLDDGFVKEVSYVGELVRDNMANANWLLAAARFAGYYTVSLVPFGVNPSDGIPCGNGYLTLTVDATGTAKYAGLLADGTAVSGSSLIALRGDLADPSKCSALIPIGIYAYPWSFGGMLKLDWGEDAGGYVATTVDSRESLEWNKDGASSSFDEQGFKLDIRPTGGWYNTLVNLQTYYLDRDFSVEAQAVDGVSPDMLPVGNSYTVDTMPHGVNVLLGRSSLIPDSRVLVPRANSALYDLAASVNPWKVKTSFVPETGIVTGSFKAWSDGVTQSQFATLNHYGVLLMNRDDASPLDVDVWTAGFYILPVTDDWTFSLPFNIKATKVDRDWSEAVVPMSE